MGLAGRFNPLRPKLWGKCVAIIVGVYFSHNGSVCERKRLGVDLGTTDDPDLFKLLTK